MKRTLLVLGLTLVLTGCDAFDGTPNDINSASRPITIEAIGKDGVILRSATGYLMTYSKSTEFASILIESGIKAGDSIK